MSNISQQVQSAKNINELCTVLDEFNSEENDGLALSDCIDLCSLPVFGMEPGDTCEIFSYDNEHVLIDNSGVLEGEAWINTIEQE